MLYGFRYMHMVGQKPGSTSTFMRLVWFGHEYAGRVRFGLRWLQGRLDLSVVVSRFLFVLATCLALVREPVDQFHVVSLLHACHACIQLCRVELAKFIPAGHCSQEHPHSHFLLLAPSDHTSTWPQA